jgi:signal transduction histidine kinase
VFKLRLAQARCELMAGRPAEARRRAEELLPRARTHPDRAAAYRLQSTLHLAAGEVEASMACLLECLERIGMPMPPSPTPEEVRAVDAEVWALLAERSIESLTSLPPMVDPVMTAVMGVLADLSVPAFYLGSSLLPFHLCRMVALSLRHGNTGASAHGYAWYGMICCVTGAERYEEGYAFGRVAQGMVERPEFSAYRSDAMFVLAHLSRWVRPLSVSQALFQETFHHALQGGDFRNACYCCDNLVSDQLLMGRELGEVYRDAEERLEFTRRASYEDIGTIITLYQRHVQQLRGLSESLHSLDGEDFSESRFEAQLASRANPLISSIYFVTKGKARFLGGAPEEAREALVAAGKHRQVMSGLIARYEYELYSALSLAACLPGAPREQREELLDTLRRHHQQFAVWARHCPENFRGAERMVAAELARVTGSAQEAMRAYEEALHAAREHGMLPQAALAAELAAHFSRECGMATAASAYAREAWRAYRQWGAEGKLRHLEATWPRLAASSEGSGGAASHPAQLDALTLVKAQQAVSGEIVQDELVATLMSVTLQSAGAQRGALLLREGELLTVAAISDASGTRLREGHEELPWTLLAYVRRTGEPALIGDTSQPHVFSSDAELLRRQARSVLCLPLRRKEELQGALYLENSLTTEAFSPERVALLSHIASQAAISIENARLYTEVQRAEAALRQSNEELERRVEERTRELTQTQSQLVETARIVGMAEVATNVLHDVGNALTSVVTDTDAIRRATSASRLGRIKQVAHLLEQHRKDLPGFFAQDPRGPQLVDYLSGLAQELAQEQVALQHMLQEQAQHVNQVRDIIQMQRVYATSTQLPPEECELSTLLEEALRLQQGALRKVGVQVTRQVNPLPRVKVDRYKVLQILCNLLSNACHALAPMPPGSRHLVVRLEASGGWARFQVVDNGAGFAPELETLLFSQGFSTREGGYGVGLHSSALAAQLLGGRLALESEGPQKGATATLELPISQSLSGEGR